jgi:predicted DNA binding protein
MMLEASIVVKPLESWAVDISKRVRAPIVISECTATRDGEVSGLVEILLEGVSREGVLRELERHPDVDCWHVAQETPDNRLLCSLTVKKWAVCSALQRPHCYIRSAKTRKNGWLEWNLVVSDVEVLNNIIRKLKNDGCNVELIRKRELNDYQVLTKRQEEIVRKALEMGYFDYPRGVTGRELSRRLEISQSTLYEILQNSQKKLVEMYFLKKD